MKFGIILWLMISFSVFGQNGLKIASHELQEKIPFRLINNLIFVEAQINGVPMTLLLDTGVSETILFSIDDKEINLKEVEKLNFTGLGDGVETQGLVSKKNEIKIGNFQDANHTVYIILDVDFNFSSQVGIPVNGIIGHDFFVNHPIKIDYPRKKITVFTDRNKLKKKLKKYNAIPMAIINNKPYIYTEVMIKNSNVSSKLLIDTGNSDALWLFPSKMKEFQWNEPYIEDYLGRGFNGDIYGKKNRIKQLQIGPFLLKKITTSMPEDLAIKNLKFVPDRVGSIGEEILKRFDVVFDYQNEVLWIKKNQFFDDVFQFNLSGLEFKHIGMHWQKSDSETKETIANNTQSENVVFKNFQYQFQLKPLYAIASCRPNSPAFLAGVQKEDQLVSINGKPATEMTLQEINSIMKKEEGKQITLKIIRKGVPMNFSFILKDPIPYVEE